MKLLNVHSYISMKNRNIHLVIADLAAAPHCELKPEILFILLFSAMEQYKSALEY